MDMPAIPTAEELEELSDEQLAELRAELLAAFDELDAEDTDEAVAAQGTLADGIDLIAAEETKRTEAAEERQNRRAAIAARVRGEDEPEPEDGDEEQNEGEENGEPEGNADEPQPEPQPEPERQPVAAAAAKPPTRRRPTQAAVASRRSLAQGPREPSHPAITITAAADVPGYSSGQQLAGLHDVAQALITRQHAFKTAQTRGREDVVVASVHANLPDERNLGNDPQANQERIDEVTSPEAITAAGGICAPLTPYYDLMSIVSAKRPVRDALPTFGAPRGGIIVQTPPLFEATAAGVGYITAADDLAGPPDSTKPCITMTCPAPTSYEIAAISHCVQFGNFASRAYPELVQNWLTNVMAAWARVAETALLDGIAACSKQISAAATYGAARQLIGTLAKAHAGFVNTNRTDENLRLRLLAPAWYREAVVADLAFSSGYDPAFIERGLAIFDAAIRAAGYNVSWYIDSATGRGQLLNAGVRETDNSALFMFPDQANFYIFPEGSFLFLDGGTLDFGLVRDSVLNPDNNYQIFAETFEQVACVGVEAWELIVPFLADGGYAPAETAITDF